MNPKIIRSEKKCSTIYYSVTIRLANGNTIDLSVTIERDSRGDSLSDYHSKTDSPTDWNSLSEPEKEAIRLELVNEFQD